MLYAPGEDANLVEVKGQTRFGRAECSDVLGNLVVGHIRFRIVDVHDHVSTDDALALSILPDLVGDVDVDAAAEQPTHTPLGIANEPPVLHGNFRLVHGGGGFGLCNYGLGG